MQFTTISPILPVLFRVTKGHGLATVVHVNKGHGFAIEKYKYLKSHMGIFCACVVDRVWGLDMACGRGLAELGAPCRAVVT